MNNQDQERIYKLCFYCEYPIIENDRIAISSIIHGGLKYNITDRHKKKLGIVGDVAVFEPDLIHLHCYEKITLELVKSNTIELFVYDTYPPSEEVPLRILNTIKSMYGEGSGWVRPGLTRGNLERAIAGFRYDCETQEEIELAVARFLYSVGYNSPKDAERVVKAEQAMERLIEKNRRMEQYQQLRKEIEAMPQYEHWRQAVFQKFGRKCAVCGSTENLEVDHRYMSFYAIMQKYGITNTVQAYECVLLWDVNNGAPLCKTHHDQTASSKYRERKLT